VKYKKTFVLICTVAIVTLLGVSNLHAIISGGKHDLTAPIGNTATDGGLASNSVIARGSECRYCHAPHNTATLAPLWDRADSSASFTMYNSPSMNATANVNGNSMGCLSCHDGVTSLDSIGGVVGGGDALGVYTGLAPGSLVGTDLSNDHPIGVDFTDLDGLEDTSTVLTAQLTLYGPGEDTVECASCHDAHSDNSFFMRLSDNTSLCTTCHVK
jgi:predicted CXXCH cytochrome family protein